MIKLIETFDAFMMLTFYMLLAMFAIAAWSVPCIGLYCLIAYVVG